jgi:tagatose 6-phosphate kinase
VITTVTLNAAIDKTYYMSGFDLNKINRVQQMYTEPGGKGINVAKVLKFLGIPVVASGFVGGFNGRGICRSLDMIGIDHQFVKVEGESRLCLNIIDEKQKIQTEILESGPLISEKEWEALKYKLSKLAAKSHFLIFSGSLAKGINKDAYSQLIKTAHENGAKSVLDTSGHALTEAISAIPYMIKPNREELSQLINKPSINNQDILNAMQLLYNDGISVVVVSLGAEGALVCYHGQFFKIVPPTVRSVNAVGCGDSIVAGISAGLYSNIGIENSLILGAAAAANNALQKNAGNINLEDIERLKSEVKIESVSV